MGMCDTACEWTNGPAMSSGVVIVGGGLAAQRCCETLRLRGFEGRIRIVSDEPRPPYDRPPLSKAVLTGERDPASLGLRSPEWYAEHDVELLLGERAVALDPDRKAVTLASGSILGYDSVWWRLGAARAFCPAPKASPTRIPCGPPRMPSLSATRFGVEVA